MTRKARFFWPTFLIWLVIDQATKLWVVRNIREGVREDNIQVIPGFFDIAHAENPGAAFGLLTSFEYRHLIFLVFTLAAIGVIVDLYRRLPATDRLLPVALGLILSGAVGNAIDRVTKRTVTDFLRVYTDDPDLAATLVSWFGMAEWPSFNVADSALLVGVVLFFVHATFFEEADDVGGTSAEPPPTPEEPG